MLVLNIPFTSLPCIILIKFIFFQFSYSQGSCTMLHVYFTLFIQHSHTNSNDFIIYFWCSTNQIQHFFFIVSFFIYFKRWKFAASVKSTNGISTNDFVWNILFTTMERYLNCKNGKENISSHLFFLKINIKIYDTTLCAFLFFYTDGCHWKIPYLMSANIFFELCSWNGGHLSIETTHNQEHLKVMRNFFLCKKKVVQ